MKPDGNILILCAKNSARSQMAEAQGSEIHPLAYGLPLTRQRSKDARAYLGRLAVHHLVVVCAQTERECPKLFPRAVRQYTWPFADPVAVEGSLETRLAAFREARDGIEQRVLDWLGDPDVGLVGARR